MRVADLNRAQTLVTKRDTAQAMADRIAAGERLHFILGEGSAASEIVAAESYVAQIASDLGKALALRVERLTNELTAMGVEP